MLFWGSQSSWDSQHTIFFVWEVLEWGKIPTPPPALAEKDGGSSAAPEPPRGAEHQRPHSVPETFYTSGCPLVPQSKVALEKKKRHNFIHTKTGFLLLFSQRREKLLPPSTQCLTLHSVTAVPEPKTPCPWAPGGTKPLIWKSGAFTPPEPRWETIKKEKCWKICLTFFTAHAFYCFKRWFRRKDIQNSKRVQSGAISLPVLGCSSFEF